MALSKEYRLSKNDFKNVFEKGETVKSSFFFLNFLKNNKGHLRLAVAVPTKVFKKAVARNKVKRMVTGVLKNSHLYGQAIDLVIIATETIVGKGLKEIKRELEQTIDKKFVK